MQRVIDEMTKAKGDVERELRKYIPEIIKECMAFSYLGKTFTFDIQDLSDRVNERLVSLSDAIHEDIESRAKTAIKYAEEEDDEGAILLYINRKIGEEDMNSQMKYSGILTTLSFLLYGKKHLMQDIIRLQSEAVATPMGKATKGIYSRH